MPELIPQAAPGRGYTVRRREIDDVIQRVMAAGRYVLGPQVEAFEAEFAAYLGLDHAIGVANGTDALELALRALGIGAGDAVFTVSHTAVATIAGIEATGATPVFVDVDPATFLMDVDRLKIAIRATSAGHPGRPAAIVPVHLYGQMADMPAILDVAKSEGLRVVEDCAQAHGARLNGRLAGAWGDAGAFSFYPTKNLAAFGDAGLVATSNAETAAGVRMLREYGWSKERVSLRAGRNSRLDELQASVLRVGLAHLDEDNRHRQKFAARYDESGSDALILPIVMSDRDHVYHQYVVRTARRDEFRKHMEREGIGTGIHYPLPVHLQPAYGRLRGNESLRNTEQLALEIVSLPMFPWLTESEIERVCAAISSWKPGE